MRGNSLVHGIAIGYRHVEEEIQHLIVPEPPGRRIFAVLIRLLSPQQKPVIGKRIAFDGKVRIAQYDEFTLSAHGFAAKLIDMLAKGGEREFRTLIISRISRG